jgi:hypothetical protein
MSPDRILTDTFRAHEYLAPDAETTLDAVQHTIRSRHRRRVGGLAVAGAAAAVTAVVLAGSLVGGQTAGGQRAPNRSVPAGRATQPPPNLPLLRITSTTLPAGSREIGAWVQGTHQIRNFETTQAGLGTVSISVSVTPGAAGIPIYSKRGVRHDFTANGHPAAEWVADDWYLAGVAMPSRNLVEVYVNGGANQGKGHDGSAAALAAIGRQVARGIVLDRRDPMRTRFTLDHVPAGLPVREVSGPVYTRFLLARPGVDAVTDAVPNISVGEYPGTARQFVDKMGNKGGRQFLHLTPTAPVHGVRAYIVTGHGQPSLFVESLAPGVSVGLQASQPGVASMAELRRIAEGIRLR